ncbi:4646_t:CDS:2, partial [Funneliformis geosporum]
MKNFGKYYDLYLETDVLLLADVFMNYAIMYLKDDDLDPSYYISTPEMFNDSLYKSSRAKLKLMINMDEYLIVENDICGDMTMANYIEKNIRKRKIVKANRDEFRIIYYKVKNNAVFGKQIENICKHMKVELLHTNEDKKIRYLASSLLYK